MKKVLFIVAAAALFFSCEKEIEPVNPAASGKGFTFTAGIENLATKADINSSNELVWASGDKIGVYVNDSSWETKNQQFNLEGNGGSTTGKFVWNEDGGNFTNQNAAFAFFPWQGTGSDKNNIYEGTMYFKMPGSYASYTSGQMLTPLVATMTYNSESSDYAPIEFKHAGAAVKVTINNLPAGVHSLGMTVAGQQVFGDYSVNPANAGTDAMAATSANTDNNTIWLNIEPADAEREFTFLFPVPALTTPKLSFNMYDENDILVWKKNLKAQASNLTRGDVLEMPAIDIEPYAKFDTVSEDWTVIGTANGTNWTADIPMITDGTVCITKGVSFEAAGEFKVRKGKAWDESYPEGYDNNYVVTAAGTYDIIFDSSTKEIKAVASKCPYPAVPISIGIDGDMSEWASITGTVRTATSGNAIEQVKAYADEDYVYVYVKRAKLGRYTQLWGTGSYYYYGFDLDNDPETGAYAKNGSNWEAWSYLNIFGDTEGVFNTTPSGGTNGMSISNVTCNGVVTDDAIEVEIAFPRDNLPDLTPGTIGVTVWGSKDAGPASTTFTVDPIEINISIDGDMSDWDKVPGASTSGVIKYFKMWNDDTNFYFYNSCEPGIRGSELWNGAGYYYYDFNLDNDSTTGDYSENGHGPYEATIAIFPFGGTSDAPAIADPLGFSNNQGVTTNGISLKGVISDNLIEVEFVIPRANFTTQVQAGDVITVYNWRAKGGNETTLTYTVK